MVQYIKGFAKQPTTPAPPQPGSPTAPPSDVSGGSATFSTPNVLLAWTAATPATGFSIVGYLINRKKSTDSTWLTFGSHLSNSTPSDIDTGATPGFTWNYRFKALQSDGQYSANWSSTASVVVSAATNGPDVTAPPAPVLSSATGVTDTSFTIASTLVTDPAHSTDVVTGTQVYRLYQGATQTATYYHPRITVAERAVLVSNGIGATPTATSDTGSAVTGHGYNLYGSTDKFRGYSTQIQGGFTRTQTFSSFTGTDKGGHHLRAGLDPSAPFATVGVYYSGSQAYMTFEYRLTQGGQAAQFAATAVTFPFTVETTWAPETNTVSARYKIGSGSWVAVDNAGATLSKQVNLGRYVESMRFAISESSEASEGTAVIGYTTDSISLATSATFVSGSNSAAAVSSCTVTAEDGATPPNVSAASNTITVTQTGTAPGGGGSVPANSRTAVCWHGYQSYSAASIRMIARHAYSSVSLGFTGTGSAPDGSWTTFQQFADIGHAYNAAHKFFNYEIPISQYESRGTNPSPVRAAWLDTNRGWLYVDHNVVPGTVVEAFNGFYNRPPDTYIGETNITNYCPADSNGKKFSAWFPYNVRTTYMDATPGFAGNWCDGVGLEPNNGADGDWKNDGVFRDGSSILSDWQTGYKALFTAFRSEMPTKLQLGNVATWGTQVDKFGQNISTYQDMLDGGLLELWYGNSVSDIGPDGSGNTNWSTAMAKYRLALSILKAPKLLNLQCNFNLTDYKSVRFCYCSTLLEDGYMTPQPYEASWDHPEYQAWWYDEFGSNLGSPTESGTSQSPWQNGVYRRTYQNGCVLVCPPGTGSRTVTMDRACHKLTGTQAPSVNDGSSIAVGGTVTIPDNDGLVLLWG